MVTSVGSPIDALVDNNLGSFVFDTRYTRMDCHNDLATDNVTRPSWVLAMWRWGDYLPGETLNGSTLFSWFSNPEWLGFFERYVLGRL